MKGVKPPAPTRKLLSAVADDAADEEDADEAGGDDAAEAEVQDLIPRNDIRWAHSECLELWDFFTCLMPSILTQ